MSATARVRSRFFNPLRGGGKPSPAWVELVARLGYAAKGVVYGLVGVLAVYSAFTAARSPGTGDAFSAIRSAPFGRLLLGLVALGLLCYAAWRFVQAGRDTERKGSDAKGLAVRAGYAVSGLLHLALAAAAGMAAAGTAAAGGSAAGGSGGGSNQERATWLLSWPGGWLLLILAGLVVVGVGLWHFRRAYRADFMKDYERVEMSPAERDWVRPIGRFGLAARGVTFCLVGTFLAAAGWRANAGRVKSLGEAFDLIARQPWGQLGLAVVAAGFVAYGLYCLSRAKYRRIAA